MKENMNTYIEKIKAKWNKRTKAQRNVLIGSCALIIILGISLLNKTKYVPLYSNLSLNEAGQIKTELDTRNIPYELSDGGTTIKVPEKQSDTLLVDFAGEGIPSSGNIDYSFFSENASWGITDNEFNMIKLGAMQTELANLIKNIDGISDADVMITLPQESVFVSDSTEQASASIVLDTQIGYEFKGNQIESLYHLVSKAIPNLPKENIHIMNQFYETYDSDLATDDTQDQYTFQQTVKKDIEGDIEQRLQQMLGAMIGMDSVIVSVTADIDFQKENRVEELVDPVDIDNMEGLPISVETIHETYTGSADGVDLEENGEGDIPGYQAVADDGDGDYELVKETINNEYNHIYKDIVESPYKVRDLGVQVAVNEIKDGQGEDIQYLSAAERTSVEDGINSILESVISTSIDKTYGEINPQDKVSIVFQEFTETQTLPVGTSTPAIPVWMYVAGAALILVIVILCVLLFRSRREPETDIAGEVAFSAEENVSNIPDEPETKSATRKKQLEKMATNKPEDFAKLLRSWIVDD